MLEQDLQRSLRELGIRLPPTGKLLLVDDELPNLMVLEALLEDDWTVRCAQSGPEALTLLSQEGPFDLVISDQRMPGMTGVELLVRIAEAHPQTMRVVLTAFSDVAPMVKAINCGQVHHFLLKPYDAAELRAMVRDALRLKAVADALHVLHQVLAERQQALERTLRAQRAAEEQLAAAERMATFGRVLSGIVHDLSNQLGTMGILLEAVQESAAHPELRATAQQAWAAATSQLELLQLMRDLARATSSSFEPTLLRTEAFIEASLDVFNRERVSDTCKVEVRIDPHASVLQIDEFRARLGLLALLRNAATAGDDRAPIALEVVAHNAQGVEFLVRDQGCGMDAETRCRATDPFFKRFATPGPGLGLELARVAAECHGGSLGLESSPGRGTLARLHLAEACALAGSEDP